MKTSAAIAQKTQAVLIHSFRLQIKFFEVSEEELEVQRAAFAVGQLPLETAEQPFDMAAYNKFVADVAPEAAEFHKQQQAAAANQVGLQELSPTATCCR